MQKAITIKDLARELNISPTTVSKALKNYPDISDKTKEKVRELADRWNYSPNILAQNLRNSSSRTIGLIIPKVTNIFFAQVISGVSDYAQQNGYMVVVLESSESYEMEKKQIELLKNFKVDGILISLANDTTDLSHLENLKNYGIPLVMYDKIEPDFPCSKVNVDDYSAAYNATEHLINQGYKNIAHLGGDLMPRTAKNRLKGYRDALIKNGRNFNEKLVHRTNKGTIEEGKKAMKLLLKKNPKIDAVFCICDMIATGALEAVKENGKKVPEDVAIIGFSNSFITTISEPKLSTIHQPGDVIGREAIKQLIHEINEKNEEGKFKTITIPTELVIRGTSQKN